MKRKALSLILAAVMLLICFPTFTLAADNDGAINVYWDKERQTIEGFGASYAFRQADNLLNFYPEETQNEIMDLMFDKEKGIGLSIIRNMVGEAVDLGNPSFGSPEGWGMWWNGTVPTFKTAANPTETPSTIDPETGKSNLDGDNYRWFYDGPAAVDYETNEPFKKYGWDLSPSDRGQVWLMKEAEKYNEKNGDVIKNISSIWTPPVWMKQGVSGAAPNIYQGTVPAANYQWFAEYMADYIEGYKKYYDLDIYGLSISNEPTHTGGYSSCTWTNNTLRDVIKVIGPEFVKRGIPTQKIQGTEHMNWNENYITGILNDPEALQYLGAAIWHPYGWNETSGFGVLPNTKRLGLPIWETEVCNLGTEANNIRTALSHARLLNRQMTIAETNAYCYWWGFAHVASDNLYGGGGNDDVDGSGALVYLVKKNNVFTGEYQIYKRYYVFGQYSKFIRPGWVRVENEQPVVADLQTSAYKDPETGEFAVVVVNSNNSSRSFDLNLLGAGASSVTAWRTSDTENLDNLGEIALVNGSATVDIPGQSITTFVGKATEEKEYTINGCQTVDAKLYNAIEGGYLNNNAALSQGIFQAYATSGTSANAKATYKNISLGGNTSGSMTVRLASAAPATVDIYIDSVAPENLAGSANASLSSANTYVNVEVPLNTKVSGAHDVIIAVKSSANNQTISVDSFLFDDGLPKPLAGDAYYGSPAGIDDALWAIAKPLSIGKDAPDFTDYAHGVAKVMWDDSNLYVRVDVSDAVLDSSSADPAMQDSVDVFLSEQAVRGPYTADDGNQYNVTFKGAYSSKYTNTAVKTDAKILDDGSGYAVYMAIPLTQTAKERKSFTFDVQINNASGGVRTGVTGWSNPLGDSCDTSVYWGDLSLLKGRATVVKTTEIPDISSDSLWTNAQVLDVNRVVQNDASTLATGKAKTLWDDSNLYVRVEVTDPNLNGANSADYLKDSVEVYLSEQAIRGSYSSANGNQYRLTYTGNLSGKTTNTAAYTAIRDNAWRREAKITDSGYVVYMAIPLTANPVAGKVFTFDIQINDATTPANNRTGQTSWNDPAANGYSSADGWGELVLLDEGEIPGPVVPADPELTITTDAHLVKNGDYFRVNASFDKEVKSNTAVLNYEFDTSKFSYRNYTPAEGVSVVSAEATDTGAKIVIMIPGYNTQDYGELLLSAKEDVDLENEDNGISVKVDYVILNDDGEKEIQQASACTSFTSVAPPPVDGYTLIDLSNMIDIFGMTKDHADWGKYRFFDFNNNGEIDINDISTLASKIK